jgi:glycogen(starch) synthase
MKITVVSNVFPPEVHGGYELLARDVAEGLRARGHEVSVLTTGAYNDEHARDLVLSRPFGEPAGRDRLRHAAAAVHNASATRRFIARRGRPHAALVMSLRRLGLAPLRALINEGVASVVTVNDDWPLSFVPRADGDTVRERIGAALDRAPMASHTWGSLRVPRPVYLSHTLRRAVLAGGAPFGEGIVRAQGVDRRLFSPRPFRPANRHAPRLLFAGRLNPEKAPDLAIDAVARLRAAGVAATLSLAGDFVSDAYERELRARARPLGDAVTFLGAVPRDELPAHYRRADALVFASRMVSEGMGLTWLEAMSCGVPVVAAPAGGAREFLEAHPCAALCEDEPDAMARTIRQLIEDEPAQRALVERALAVIAQHASLDGYVATLEAELYAAAHERIDSAR